MQFAYQVFASGCNGTVHDAENRYICCAKMAAMDHNSSLRGLFCPLTDRFWYALSTLPKTMRGSSLNIWPARCVMNRRGCRSCCLMIRDAQVQMLIWNNLNEM